VTFPSAGGAARSGAASRSGLALLRKPEGITSFQALSPMKRALGSGKVGHAGTLDRFASGLLVALAGPYSRLASFAQRGEKRYRGLIAFGAETATLDPEGEVVAEAPPPGRSDLEAALLQFRGRIMQRPPAYSALHVGGRRAYEIARKGSEPRLAERPVEIFALELVSYEEGSALIELRCSSGTYVRSLARDIALACGSRAHLAALERLAIGPFRVEEAMAPEAFDPERDLRALSPSEASALGLRALALRDEGEAARFAQGGRIDPEALSALDAGADALDCEGAVHASDSAVFDASGRLLGMARLEAGALRYLAVLPRGGGGEA
jgi:tRNA pseudouridine55 synthase